jgi:trk system potassium uptake protein TrkH
VISVFKAKTPKSKRFFRHLTLHSKIAIVASVALILGGGLLILIFEYSNPLTIGNMSMFDKIQVALFQSVTTRTAGFASIPQENLTNASSAVSLILMMIGGSPVGTAGGMKTVTVIVLLSSALSTVTNKRDTTLFGRRVSDASMRKAVAVSVVFLTICAISSILLMASTDVGPLDAVYESISAAATVGLSRNLTSSLSDIGRIIIIVTMYLGRVGPISLAVALGSKNESQNVISAPSEEISIG